MRKGLNDHRSEKDPQGLLDEILVIPQDLLHAVLDRVRKLRLLVVVLVSICIILGAAWFQGREAASRLLLLEEANRAKDATIEKLRHENQRLEGKLTFQHRVDDLEARIKQEASWLDRTLIRPAVEMALAYTTDPALYLAIGLVEAGLRADVVHPDGVALGMHGICPKDWHGFLQARGIMQRREDYFDPVKSFRGSEAVLSALVLKWGSLEKALLYYNGGRPAAAGLVPQSKAYAERVLRLRSLFAASLQGDQELRQEGNNLAPRVGRAPAPPAGIAFGLRRLTHWRLIPTPAG